MLPKTSSAAYGFAATIKGMYHTLTTVLWWWRWRRLQTKYTLLTDTDNAKWKVNAHTYKRIQCYDDDVDVVTKHMSGP